jgi:hypothetical protein
MLLIHSLLINYKRMTEYFEIHLDEEFRVNQVYLVM